MLSAFLSLTFAIVQPSVPESPAADPALVEDPFDLTAGPAPAVEEPAAGPEAAAPSRIGGGSTKQLICRRRPELGTRLRYFRVCMTAQEWETHEVHMEQQRRDINDWGAQGMGGGPQ